MRSAVDEILAFNRGFRPEFLHNKLDKLSASPFGFFRGTFHVWCRDLREDPFKKWICLDIAGPIVGDLHTENFGSFRAITNEIVYDINDFDETTRGLYEYDLRRLATSLLLAALDNRRTLGDGMNAAEAAVRGYLETIVRLGRVRKRVELERLPEAKQVRQLLSAAAEKKRAEFLKGIAVETTPGSFVFRASEKYLPVKDKVRRMARKSLPFFLRHCLAPPKARPAKYSFQDIAFRIAGTGSLGRARYALLLGKGRKKEETYETLRLIEWKESLESALNSGAVRHRLKRPREVIEATRAFQLFPKRYLGYTWLGEVPMQAREIGANDLRFDHKQFRELDRFLAASRIFGEITARAHLLGSLGKPGPREIPQEISRREDRFVYHLLRFAVAYAGRVMDGHEELVRRKEEVARAWRS